jgi:hypothetical protein
MKTNRKGKELTRDRSVAFRRGPKSNLDIEEVKKLYAELRSLDKVAKRMGVTSPTISKALKEAGVKVQKRGNQKKPDAMPNCTRYLKWKERQEGKDDSTAN